MGPTYLSFIDSPQTLKAGEETGNPDHVNYSTVDRWHTVGMNSQAVKPYYISVT